MSKFFASVEQSVGNTPIVELVHLQQELGLKARLFAKLEYFNPGGSVKDRVAKAMLDEAENSGVLQPNAVIIEPTSGNTGIGLAMVGVARGYRVIIVMPETMSAERKKLMTAYGAELVLTDGAKGMQGSIEKARELAQQIPNSFIPDQFSNSANAKAHREGTGVEIYNQLNGAVDIFVAGVGTGGTITGVGEYLKAKNPAVRIVAVEPANSPILSGGKAGAHGIQGIGAGFVPAVLNREIYDEVIPIADEEAFSYARKVAQTDGTLVGISAGAALCAAVQVASRQENAGKNIVVLFPDGGDRYLSTDLF